MVTTISVPTVRHDPATPSPGDSLVGPPQVAPTSDLRGRVSRLLLLRTIVVSVVLALSL